MSDEHAVTAPHDPSEESFAESKGKGKSVEEPQHSAMEEDDDDENDDDDDDDDDEAHEDQEGDEDGLEEIDTNNIVEGGRRTRGAKIDFAKAAEENPADDDEDEDDDDFRPAGEDTEMSG